MSLLAAIALTLAGAAPNAYQQTILSQQGLVAYWPMDGDLRPARGQVEFAPQGGRPQFADGPAGKSLVLDGRRFLAGGDSPQLDLANTTVELCFLASFAEPPYNPCLIAKRAPGDHRQTRFSVHLFRDYSALAVWNGHQVNRFRPPQGKLAPDRWYHLAITHTAQQMVLYLDGVPCLDEGPPGLFRLDQRRLPLSIGSSTPKGQELWTGRIAQVAFYAHALCACDIARHVDALGWQQRRLDLVRAVEEQARREAQLRAEQDARRADLAKQLLADPALEARGQSRVYRGESLDAVSLPLGGIGAGSIQINGAAELAAWQIFNNFNMIRVPNSFLAVRAKPANRPATVRALQTVAAGPFAPMKTLGFRGEYPFAWYDFEDPQLPVKVSLEAFNPLVPLDEKASGIPCAVFNVTVENPAGEPVEVSLLAAQQNAVGYLGPDPIEGRTCPAYGGNRNQVLSGPKATVLHMTSSKPATDPGFGDMALAAIGRPASAAATFDSLHALAAQFARDGKLAGPDKAGPSPSGQTIDGALAVAVALPAHAKQTVTFALTWHFPGGRHGAGPWGGAGNMYANWWPSARAVSEFLAGELPKLTAGTRLYHDALYESNLPYWLLDRISSQVAILRSPTCFWTRDGYFGAWEGCCRAKGCCQGNCNHVWHYAQAHARLFPAIARRMRQQEFRFQAPDGAIPHRQPKSFPAFDGQCGAVLNSYREHLMSPDGRWLAANWGSVKRAMEYLIATWDQDEDGVLAGAQWNTLDGALGGSSSWLGSLYLGALAAAERMALLENDVRSAQRYARIRTSGAEKQDRTLFNGEYYIQIPDPEPREDYNTGCEIDQVLGQWWAHQLDLGWLYPRAHVQSALAALLKHNFRGNFQGLAQLPRKFVADDDPGTQMISWPDGKRPVKCIRYATEVMTGFEYSAAAAMIQAGLVREGLCVARAVWLRYDGRLRLQLTPSDTASWGYSGNPFGDDECGKFYARAMSSWSLLLACQGFLYDGPAATLGFLPAWKPANHKSFFTTAESIGLFSQRLQGLVQTERIEVRAGRLPVARLVFAPGRNSRPAKITVEAAGQQAAAKWEHAGGRITLRLDNPVTLDPKTPLAVRIRFPE